MSTFVSPRQLAEQTGVSERTLRQKARALGACRVLGKTMFLTESDVATILEALRSPLFMAYRRRQPFNHNHLRPCPVLDNPEAILEMVNESGAKSTDMEAPEDVDVLSAKTAKAAERWAITAERLWAENLKSRDSETCDISQEK